MIEVGEARRLVLEGVAPLASEQVPLGDALERVLASDVRSRQAVPGFDNSAMDGFAVRAADTAGARDGSPVSLRLAGEARAGLPAGVELGGGDAIAISTGAMVPEGADAVVRVEDTSSRNGHVEVLAEVSPGRELRRAGEDVAEGEIVLRGGTTLGPAELGVLASVGRDTVACTRRLCLSIVVSGDELVPAGEPLGPGQIHDSNAHTLPALAVRAGAAVGPVARVGDDPEATGEALAAALDADVVVVSGGVSVGEHDHVKASLAELGVRQVFWGIALRPGKPTWFGVHPDGALVFGLPGNPVSAVVCFLLLVRPAILAMQGADPASERVIAILDQAYPKKPGRAHAVRCRMRLEADGWHATPTGAQGSHVLTSMLGAHALAMIPTGSDGVSAGERVEVELIPGAR